MLLSYGVVTGIYFTLNVVVPKGEKVLVFTPVYDPFFAAVKNSGKAVVLCNLHNPIGRVWTGEEMERIVDRCVKYEAYLLSDEIHSDFGLVRPYTTAGRFEKIYDRLVVYTAISKTFNMAGLGSSCMIIPNKELKQKIFDSYDVCWMFGPCDLAFTAMEAAYTYGDTWVDEQMEYLKGNVELVNNSADYPGWVQ